ncbi:DUF2264 domain-containing protein [Georgenia faecalis]|uniref:DUF2264 domain-containing protein n=1 Tax=Georgenia faecalis TaxID=2483799 RepID=UPI000FD907CA|nr:DUF2264 domain-containing protein [Georgenia faecalis]
MTRPDLAPLTGWDRARWADLADRMLLAVREHASPDHARIVPPGAPAAFGPDVAGLEGFARTFLLAGFRLAGDGGEDRLGLAQWYADGLAAGTDPGNRGRWVRPAESGQAKVEAASIALILDMTRPWIWDRLDPAVQQQVVDYLAVVVGDDGYPHNNWRWFRIVVQTFLRSVGGPWSREDIETDLALLDSFVRADGWISDGPLRAYDHYAGWALHLYPALWARMWGAQDLAAGRVERDRERLDRYLLDAVRLVGADGAPLLQGRSLVYRFATAAPFWAGAMSRVPSLSPGLLRRAASGVLAHFVPHVDRDGTALLTLGWHGPWPAMAQHYSGPSSPYWAAKGMLGLALPATDPVWTSTEEPLPHERADQLFTASAPGWLISATRTDGVVRVVNHGTDYASPGDQGGDAPAYAQLGYSTATSPRLTADARTDPIEQSVALIDAAGRTTHRTGFTAGAVGLHADGATAAVGGSVARAHWLTEAPGHLDYGPGAAGDAVDVALLRTVSVLRGPWEVRLVRVEALPDGPAPADGLTLRVGGWAVSGDGPGQDRCRPDDVLADAGVAGLRSVAAGAAGFETAGVRRERDVSPLGGTTLTPWVSAPAVLDRWYAVVLGLERAPADGDARLPEVDLPGTADRVVVRWPDGAGSTVPLAGVTPAAEDLTRQGAAMSPG